jgi:putative colanic acid biosynthesis glycosyltransferase WcaI
MRILFINQYFPPDATNTANLLGALCEDLSQDHEVWVVAGRPSYNPQANTYRPVGMNLSRAWSSSFSRAGMPGRLANYATFMCTALFRSRRVPKPDVVVALTDPPVIGLIGLLAASRHRAPFVQVYMDIHPDVGVALNRLNNPLLVKAWRRLNGWIRSRASGVVAIGRDMARKLSEEGVEASKITIIPNWAEDVQIDHDAVRGARTTMGWTERFVVMHAGNVGLAQNLGALIDAAQALQDLPEVLVVIMGEGAARGRLEREAQARGLSNVAFLPYAPTEEAKVLIGAADLHVISLAPGLGGCLVPSKAYGILAAGKPFVAAVEPDSELGLLVGESRCGLLVPPGDPKGLADAIQHLRDQPDPEIGKAGRRAFQARYRRDQATKAYEDLLVGLTSPMSAPTSF